MIESPWMTVEEVAEYLKTTPEALHQLRTRGDGPPAHKVGRRLLFWRDDINAWVGAHREPEKPKPVNGDISKSRRGKAARAASAA